MKTMRGTIILVLAMLISACASDVRKGGDPFVEKHYGVVWYRDVPVTRPITLVTADGDIVTRLDPTPYFDDARTLPNLIVWKGRAFERGWTNEGNTDADERLWFEVAK